MSPRNTSGRGGGRHKSGRHSHSTSGRTARHGGSHGPSHRESAAEPSPLVGKVLELHIMTLALGGAGVARMPETVEGIENFTGAGMAVFVEGALPGATVRARITQVHRRHAEALAVETLSPSPEAVTPACPHFLPEGGLCGGCPLQDLHPARQLAWKERQILEALKRIGKVEPQTVLPAVAAPKTYRFRNKMEFAFQGSGEALRLGLYSRRDPGRVVALSCCHLLPEAGEEILLAVGKRCSTAGLYALDRKSGEGYLRHLVLRHSTHQGALLAQLLTTPGSESQARMVRELGEALLSEFPQLKTFVHAERTRLDGLAQAERTLLTLGASALEERLEDVRYAISADAFFQTSTSGALALYSALRTLADLTPTDTVFDLYCGGGGIALFLARHAGRVLGLEVNPAAIADAEANAKLNQAANCRFLRAELAGDAPLPERLPEGFEKPDVVVVDPPREGLEQGVVRWLINERPARLVYVSCNPATLARDAGLLAEGFTLSAVQAVDLFPHTAHAECLALFEPLAR